MEGEKLYRELILKSHEYRRIEAPIFHQLHVEFIETFDFFATQVFYEGWQDKKNTENLHLFLENPGLKSYIESLNIKIHSDIFYMKEKWENNSENCVYFFMPFLWERYCSISINNIVDILKDKILKGIKRIIFYNKFKNDIFSFNVFSLLIQKLTSDDHMNYVCQIIYISHDIENLIILKNITSHLDCKTSFYQLSFPSVSSLMSIFSSEKDLLDAISRLIESEKKHHINQISLSQESFKIFYGKDIDIGSEEYLLSDISEAVWDFNFDAIKKMIEEDFVSNYKKDFFNIIGSLYFAKNICPETIVGKWFDILQKNNQESIEKFLLFLTENKQYLKECLILFLSRLVFLSHENIVFICRFFKKEAFDDIFLKEIEEFPFSLKKSKEILKVIEIYHDHLSIEKKEQEIYSLQFDAKEIEELKKTHPRIFSAYKYRILTILPTHMQSLSRFQMVFDELNLFCTFLPPPMQVISYINMADIYAASGKCELGLKYIFIAVSLSHYNEVSLRLKALAEYNFLMVFLSGGIIDGSFESKIENILNLLEESNVNTLEHRFSFFWLLEGFDEKREIFICKYKEYLKKNEEKVNSHVLFELNMMEYLTSKKEIGEYSQFYDSFDKLWYLALKNKLNDIMPWIYSIYGCDRLNFIRLSIVWKYFIENKIQHKEGQLTLMSYYLKLLISGWKSEEKQLLFINNSFLKVFHVAELFHSYKDDIFEMLENMKYESDSFSHFLITFVSLISFLEHCNVICTASFQNPYGSYIRKKYYFDFATSLLHELENDDIKNVSAPKSINISSNSIEWATSFSYCEFKICKNTSIDLLGRVKFIERFLSYGSHTYLSWKMNETTKTIENMIQENLEQASLLNRLLEQERRKLEDAHQQLLEYEKERTKMFELQKQMYATKKLSQLALSIAHEINNPLQIALLRIEEVLEEDENNENLKSILNEIERCSHVLKQLDELKQKAYDAKNVEQISSLCG